MQPRLHLLIGLLGFSFACQDYPEINDEAAVCVETSETDGQNKLVVMAQSWGCEADHKGASLECTITVDGSTAVVHTVFQDGKDPDDVCAGPLQTTCEVDVDPGTYTIVFAGDERSLLVPSGDEACFSLDLDTSD